MTNTILHLGLMEDGEIELDLAALELAALDHPDVDLDEYIDALTDIEIALRAADGDAAGTAAQAQALSSVMVEEFGFSGDRTHYDDPQNADLIAVVDRRLGLPISLSILYVAMARRLGWSAMPLNTPGHVLVQLGDVSDPLIIDPFNDARTVAPEQVEALLEQMQAKYGFLTGCFPCRTDRRSFDCCSIRRPVPSRPAILLARWSCMTG
ncbi:MAG: transglutaminase-like domain-containing protein [Pseudomonadota bacterium]